MYQLHLGSTLSRPPSDEYIDKSFRYYEWEIPMDGLASEEKLILIRKVYLTKREKMRMWLDVFLDIFPKEVIDDAKRIAFDSMTTEINSHTSPSMVAVACLYLSCRFHGVEFNLHEVLDKKNDGLVKLGLKRRKYQKNPRMAKIIRDCARTIYLGLPNKFDKLEKLHERLEGN